MVPDTRELYYKVTYKGIPVVEKPCAEFGLDNRIWEMALGVCCLKQPACWMDNLEVDSVTTLPTDGTPGKNITMVRRKGEEWFLGAMTNNEGSQEEISLSFLDKGKTYLVSVYTDGGDKVKTRTQVKCSYLLVDASMTMKFDLKPSGGAAVRFVPIDGKEAAKYRQYKGKIM